MTSDGIEEIVVVALAEAGWASNANCIRQQLLAYEWADNTPRLIAEINGCVVQPDLYGLRFESEPAGDVTIYAADAWEIIPPDCYGGFCWYDLNDQDNVTERASC